MPTATVTIAGSIKVVRLDGAVPVPVGPQPGVMEDLAVGSGSGVPSSRQVATTAPLTGGGDLSTDRTLAISDLQPSGVGHARGAVPDPGAVAGATKYLREDASWQVPPDTIGVPTARQVATTAPLTGGGDLSADRTLAISDVQPSGGGHARGAVPDTPSAAGTAKYLREDATWSVPPDTIGVPTSRQVATTAPLTGGGDLSADRTLAISDVQPSGVGHARGAVPDPGAVAGTTKFLREDATFAVPPGTGAPTTRNINTTAPLTGGGDLSADRTLGIDDFISSGVGHARGAVPDPGVAPNSGIKTRYLREDATWQTPPGTSVAGGGPTDPLNWWWTAQVSRTGVTGISMAPVSSGAGVGGNTLSISSGGNPVIAALSDGTGIYVDVQNNTGASNANAVWSNDNPAVEFQQLPRVTIKMKTGTSLGCRLWAVLTTGSFPLGATGLNNDSLGSGLSLSGAGFRFSGAGFNGDTTWKVQTFNGTTQTTTDTGITVVANTRYDLVIDFANYPTDVRFYINGTLVHTETATLPGTATATCGVAQSVNSTATGTARSFRFGRWHIGAQT